MIFRFKKVIPPRSTCAEIDFFGFSRFMGNIPKKHEIYGVFTRGRARECSVLGAMKGFSRLARVEVLPNHNAYHLTASPRPKS